MVNDFEVNTDVDADNSEHKDVKRKRLKASDFRKDSNDGSKEAKLASGSHKDYANNSRDLWIDVEAEESDASDVDRANYSEEEDEDELIAGSDISDEMKDFIVDKAEESEVSEDASDVEYEPNELDDDDLDLIAENTGAKWSIKEDDEDEDRRTQLRRLKKGVKLKSQRFDEDEDDWLEGGDDQGHGIDMSDIWATVAECFGDVDLVVAILKNERVVTLQDDVQSTDSEHEEILQTSQNEDVLDTYADPDELEHEYMTKYDEQIRIKDEPERLNIRYKDRPRTISQRDIQDEAHWITKRLITEFTEYLSHDYVNKSYMETFKDTFQVPTTSPLEDTQEKCEMVLEWLLNNRWEIPFILYHKRHLICPPLTDSIVWRIYELDAEWFSLKLASDSIKEQIDLIGHDKVPSDVLYFSMNFDSMQDLYDVSQHLMYHYRRILAPKSVIASPKIKIFDAPKPDSPQTVVDNPEEDDYNVENDVFGDFDMEEDPQHNSTPLLNLPFHVVEQDPIGNCIQTIPEHRKSPLESPAYEPIDSLADLSIAQKNNETAATSLRKRNPGMTLVISIEELGLDEAWKSFVPRAEDFAYVLERCQDSSVTEFKVKVDNITACWKEIGMEEKIDYISVNEGAEDIQLEEYCKQWIRGSFSSGKRVYTALVNYHAKMLANNITVRRIIREAYKNYCCITCTTTPKGEAEVDAADPSWLARRLYRCSLNDLFSPKQVNYDYPKNIRDAAEKLNHITKIRDSNAPAEVYLQAQNLERLGHIKVTIHPLQATETPPWKSEEFQQRFADWHERFKLMSQGTRQIVDDVYREKMAKQKQLLEMEEMMLQKAEEKDRQWRRNLIDQLTFAYVPSTVPSLSLHRLFHREILERLVNVELIPIFRAEVREFLMKIGTNSVLIHSQKMLQYKLDVLPNYNDVVLSLIPDSPADGLRVHAAIVSEFGKVEDYIMLEWLLSNNVNTKSAGYTSLPSFKQMMSDVEKLDNMVKSYRPTVVVIGVTSVYALDLHTRVEQYLMPMLDQQIPILDLSVEVPRIISTSVVGSSFLTSNNAFAANMSLLPSSASSSRFGDMAISLARWYIDALAETSRLWCSGISKENLLTRLQLHPLQHLISQDKLQAALENVMVTVVCDAGVDLNRMRRGKHLEGPLQFVAGLGPRKALDIVGMLRITSIGTRSQLRMTPGYDMVDSMMGVGELVYYNACSFIRVNATEAIDSLDTTRIHSGESAFIAEKLAIDSLEDNLSGDQAIQEILESPQKLDDLDLEAYASILYEKQALARILPYLLFVKEELQYPYKDLRLPVRPLDNQSKFMEAMQTTTCKIGCHVLCRLDTLHHTFCKATVLPFVLKANITDYRSFRESANRIFREQGQTIDALKGTSLSARISGIDYNPFFDSGRHGYMVDVVLTGAQRRNVLTKYLYNSPIDKDGLNPLVEFDVSYSKRPLLNEFTERRKIQYRRIIRHPSYRMWPLHKTVAYLRQPEIGIGDCCICPSTECDRLNLIIKTCAEPFNCATFVIIEKNQRVPGELGKELYLQQEKYDNLDQIIAQFCETLKLNLSEFYMHPKFKPIVDLQKVERDLLQQSAMRPDSISWAIVPPNPRRSSGDSAAGSNPLKFTLVVVPPGMGLVPGDSKSLQDSIYVDHKCFRLWTHSEGSLNQLLKWWKEYGYWNRNAERHKYNMEKQRLAQRMNQQH